MSERGNPQPSGLPTGPSWWARFRAYREAPSDPGIEDSLTFGFRAWLRQSLIARSIKDLLLAGLSVLLTGWLQDVAQYRGAIGALAVLGLALLAADIVILGYYLVAAPLMQRDRLRACVRELQTKVQAYERPPTTAFARDHSALADMRDALDSIAHLLDHPQLVGPSVTHWIGSSQEARGKVQTFTRDGRLSDKARVLISVPVISEPTRTMPDVSGRRELAEEWGALERCERGLSEAMATLETHIKTVECAR